MVFIEETLVTENQGWNFEDTQCESKILIRWCRFFDPKFGAIIANVWQPRLRVCPPLKINGLLKSSLKAVNKVYFVNVAGGLTTPHAGCCQVQKLASPNIDISIAPSWPFWPAMLSQIWCSTSASRARSELVLRQSLWPFRVKPH